MICGACLQAGPLPATTINARPVPSQIAAPWMYVAWPPVTEASRQFLSTGNAAWRHPGNYCRPRSLRVVKLWDVGFVGLLELAHIEYISLSGNPFWVAH
jgi:hypothetical protein